jgi:hypothetical protein
LEWSARDAAKNRSPYEKPDERNQNNLQDRHGTYLLRTLLAEEFVEVLPKIAQGTINDSADLPLYFIDVPLFFGHPHPAELDCHPNLMVNLARAEELSHLFARIIVVWIDYTSGVLPQFASGNPCTLPHAVPRKIGYH